MRSVKMIDGSGKRNRQLAFELQNSDVSEKRSKWLGFSIPKAKEPIPNTSQSSLRHSSFCHDLFF